MATGIDHVVIAVPDPDAAAAELTERLGLAFTGGGRHPGLGTFNRLAFLGDAYLELIGVEDADAAQGWAVGRAAVRALERGGGFATWALADDAIRATVARLRANGSRIGEPVHGSRVGGDGQPTEWWTATLPELGPELPPFLIQHAAVGDEWGHRAMAARRSFMHPLGSSVRLASLELTAPDPSALASDCLVELGLGFVRDGDMASSSIGGHSVRLAPSTAADLPATVLISAEFGAPRRAEVLGVRVEVRPSSV